MTAPVKLDVDPLKCICCPSDSDASYSNSLDSLNVCIAIAESGLSAVLCKTKITNSLDALNIQKAILESGLSNILLG